MHVGKWRRIRWGPNIITPLYWTHMVENAYISQKSSSSSKFCTWFSGNFSESIYHKSFKSYKLYSSLLHNFLQILYPQSTLLIYADTPRFTTIQNKKQSNKMQHNSNKHGGQILTKHSYNILSELPPTTINHLACLRTMVYHVWNLWSPWMIPVDNTLQITPLSNAPMTAPFVDNSTHRHLYVRYCLHANSVVFMNTLSGCMSQRCRWCSFNLISTDWLISPG